MLTLSPESINFEPASGACRIFYDAANEKMITVRGNGAMGVTGRGPTPRDTINFRLTDKGEILCLKLAPSLQTAAIQRSQNGLDFVNIRGGEVEGAEFSLNLKSKSSRLLGFEWTGLSELLLISDSGFHLYLFNLEKRTFKLIKSHNIAINWYLYQASTSLLLVSTGILGTTLHPFLLRPQSFLRLGKVEIDVGTTPKPPKLILLDRDVSLGVIYGRPWILVLRHSTRGTSASLLMYQLAKEAGSGTAAVHKHTLELGRTGKFAVHVMNNLVIVHHQAAGASLVFDVAVGGVSDEAGILHHDPLMGSAAVTLPSEISADPDASYEAETPLYADSWVVLCPDLIIDPKQGCLWRLQLHIRPAIQRVRDPCTLLLFLLHRQGAKQLALETLRTVLEERRLSLASSGSVFKWILSLAASQPPSPHKINHGRKEFFLSERTLKEHEGFLTIGA